MTRRVQHVARVQPVRGKRVLGAAVLAAALTPLVACVPAIPSGADHSRDGWRLAAENQCLRVAPVTFSGGRMPMIKNGACGLYHPYHVTTFLAGAVDTTKPATLSCPMLRGAQRWLRNTVEPQAEHWYRQPVRTIEVDESYSCRHLYGRATGHVSEHAFGNAMDISAFILADGRRIDVANGWRGDRTTRHFLHAVHDGACGSFSGVLGPDYNTAHHDHFHLDQGRLHFCR